VAIALVGTPTTGVGASVTATTLSITVPTGSVGDLLVFYVSASAVSSTAGAPAITSSTAGLTQLYSFTGNSFLSAQCFYRFVQSGDPTSYTFTVNVGAPIAAVCARYSGVSTTTPFRFLNVSKSPGASGAVTTLAFSALDNVQSTDLVLAAAAMGSSVLNTTQATALSTPASWTNVVNRVGPTNAVTSSSHTAMALYSRLGGTDTPSPTGSTGAYGIMSVALIDASTLGTPQDGSVINFVNAASTGGTASATTVVVNVPSGVVNGQLMLAAVASGNGLNGWAPPSGWIPLMLANAWSNAGTASNIGDVDARIFYRFASSEPASYTFTVVNATTLAGTIVVYSGLRNPYPIYIDNVTATQGSGVTATTTSPAPYDLSTMNAIVSNGLIVNVYAASGDVSGLVSVTAPTSPWNTRVNMASNRAGGFNVAIAVVDQVAAATLPTATSNIATGWVVYSIALVGPPLTQVSADVATGAVTASTPGSSAAGTAAGSAASGAVPSSAGWVQPYLPIGGV
jgi:hypothetical protein